MIKSICRITAAAVMTLTMTSVMYAKHESNNFATLSSSIPGVIGQAVVNYVKGTEGWVSQVRVLGLPDGIYLFAVRLNAGVLQPICNFEVEGAGSGGVQRSGRRLEWLQSGCHYRPRRQCGRCLGYVRTSWYEPREIG